MRQLQLSVQKHNFVLVPLTYSKFDFFSKPYLCSPEKVRLFENGKFKKLLSGAKFGPEIAFASEIALMYPDDDIILCKGALGGSNLYYDWNPDGASKGPEDIYRGPLYCKLIDSLKKITLDLKYESPRICGLLWMQGERDSVFDFMASNYAANMQNFIECIRRDTQVEDLPIIMGAICPRVINPETGEYNHKYRRQVQSAQKKTSQNMSDVFLVATDDLPQVDSLHFDTLGLLELGRRYAQKLR